MYMYICSCTFIIFETVILLYQSKIDENLRRNLTHKKMQKFVLDTLIYFLFFEYIFDKCFILLYYIIFYFYFSFL